MMLMSLNLVQLFFNDDNKRVQIDSMRAALINEC